MGNELEKFKKGLGIKKTGVDALHTLRSSALRSSVSYQEALVLVIDYSASMNVPEVSGLTRIEAVREAVNGLLEDCTKGATRIAVVKFSDEASVVAPLTPKYELRSLPSMSTLDIMSTSPMPMVACLRAGPSSPPRIT